MKSFLFLSLAVLIMGNLLAANKDSISHYRLPDSVNASSLIAHTIITRHQSKNMVKAGIQTDQVRLYLSANRKAKELVFEFPASAKVIANGIGIHPAKGKLEWEHDWSINQSYRLLIVSVADSAANFSLYSGYVFLPALNKCKLIGTCKITGVTTSIKKPASFISAKGKNLFAAGFSDIWCQRMNGTWKNMTAGTGNTPEINLLVHADSLQQLDMDIKMIEGDMRTGKTGIMERKSDVYFTLLAEGTGKPVSLDDTVTVHYKGSLYTTNVVFDQTKEQPATFPLNRLIKGWQIGVPLCREGGKIKLVKPSALAYSIRTRAPKIPPNSILVFEIEVIKTIKK